MYRLPKLPTEYESLETLIDAIIVDGAEHVAPSSGSNLQSVQMVDLDGDGEEEAIAFFRRPGDERPMKIYVFRAEESSYEQYCLIEGTSNSIYSVSYIDLNGDGWREILAGIRGDLDVQNLAIYSVASGEARQMMVTGYARYTVRDMDDDGKQELIVLRSDEESHTVADSYAWDGAALEQTSSLRLSSTTAELNRLTAGKLSSGENALFVTAVVEDSVAITDILTMENASLRAVAAAAVSFRFLDLYPSDVNGDGITEIPDPVAFAQMDPEDPVFYRICWRQFSASGDSQVVCETYQDSGWSLLLPESWENVAVTRSTGTDGSSVSFVDTNNAEAFLIIYALTGDNRAAMAAKSGRIVLSRQAKVTYSAELINGGTDIMDEQSLRDRFSLTAAEWTTGEN